MTHILVITDGFSHNLDKWKRYMETKRYQKGWCLVREMRLYDIMTPETSRDELLQELARFSNNNMKKLKALLWPVLKLFGMKPVKSFQKKKGDTRRVKLPITGEETEIYLEVLGELPDRIREDGREMI